MPTCPGLFAITKSSTNVLLISKIFSLRYLNKYAAGKEKHLHASVETGQPNQSWKIIEGNINNTKLTSSKLHQEAELEKRRTRKQNHAATISQTEQIWWALKSPCINSSFDFIHVPSIVMERRGGVLKNFKQNLNVIEKYMTTREDLNLPQDRIFTSNQKFIIYDAFTSSYCMDKVTIFSLRPPELLCVYTMESYFNFFVREETVKSIVLLNKLLTANPHHCIDG